jgi:hypothetical protein
MMKSTLMKLGLGIILFGSCTAAMALDRGRQLLITEQVPAQNLLSTVQNAIWASDGQPTEQAKVIYVVYNPQCAWSRKFFSEHQALNSAVKFHWIPATWVPGSASVVEKRDLSAVAKAFEGEQPYGISQLAAYMRVHYNEGVQNSINYLLSPYANDRTFAYPTLIYPSAEGVKVIAGQPQDIEAVLNEVIAVKTPATPEGLAIAQLSIAITDPSVTTYTNRTGKTVKLYALPSEKAPVIETLDADYQLSATGKTESPGWLQVQPFGPQGPKAYVKI